MVDMVLIKFRSNYRLQCLTTWWHEPRAAWATSGQPSPMRRRHSPSTRHSSETSTKRPRSPASVWNTLHSRQLCFRRKWMTCIRARPRLDCRPFRSSPPAWAASSTCSTSSTVRGIKLLSNYDTYPFFFVILGILFVQISQQDIENFKKEYELRQKDGGVVKKPEIEE